jgi:hypothetical protein
VPDQLVSLPMRATTQTLLTELKSLPLLQKVGQPHVLPHRSVGSWSEALQLCHSESWDALQLMTKNRHAELVNHLNWDRCQEWNGVCAILRPEIANIVEAAFARVPATLKVTDDLRGTVSWDMLCILLDARVFCTCRGFGPAPLTARLGNRRRRLELASNHYLI